MNVIRKTALLFAAVTVLALAPLPVQAHQLPPFRPPAHCRQYQDHFVCKMPKPKPPKPCVLRCDPACYPARPARACHSG